MSARQPQQQMIASESSLDRELFGYLVEEGEDPDRHCDALASETAAVDLRYEPLSDVSRTRDRFARVMRENLFLPAPSILLEGRRNNPVLFRNAALEVDDSFEQIFSTLKRASILLQNGVKVAVDFSPLRAARSLIRSSHLQSVGPVRFMELFERAPQNLAEPTPLTFRLRVDHQDIEDYLDYAAKAPAHVRCSIGITREFMAALVSGGSLGLSFKEGGEVARRVRADALFARIGRLILEGKAVDLVFVDALRDFQDARQLSDRLVLNPQNQLTFADELMATGAINVAAFAGSRGFDQEQFGEVLSDAVHFLDNCFERNFYFDDETRDLTRMGLRIGLTAVGLDEALAVLNPEANERKDARLIMKIADAFHVSAMEASRQIGERRGFKHQIYYRGEWYKTRHSQLVAQLHLPLLSQLSRTPAYFFPRGVTFSGLLAMHRRHALWQSVSTNVASFKHPLKGMDEGKFATLLARANEMGFLTLEFA